MLTYQPLTHWSKRKRRKRRKRWIMDYGMERLKCIRWNKMYQSTNFDQRNRVHKMKQKQNEDWKSRNKQNIFGILIFDNKLELKY